MKLLIVRHGDPDYTIDSLTPKGWKEVDYLSEKLAKLDVKAFYVSPLGRARDTASLTLKKMNRTATEEPWLREFDARIHRPDVPEKEMISWDWLPQDWTAEPRFYLPDDLCLTLLRDLRGGENLIVVYNIASAATQITAERQPADHRRQTADGPSGVDK